MSADQIARLIRRGRRDRKSAEAAIAMLEHMREQIEADLSEQNSQLYRELLSRQKTLGKPTKLGKGSKLLLLLTSSLLPTTLINMSELFDGLPLS